LRVAFFSNSYLLHGNYFYSGVHVNPHPNKIQKGGEDAYGISENNRLLTMADGVGGWAESGVDPALYSRELCQIMTRF
jgi:protein phosphatase PTC7